jgi:imidazolonepropionase-like amidohydrolase
MRFAISGGWVFDGEANVCTPDAAVVVNDGVVEAITSLSDFDRMYPNVPISHRFDGCTVLPGFVNTHSHLTMPGDGSVIDEAMRVGDDALLLRAKRNAWCSLQAGVTTVTDLGARNSVSFALRSSIAKQTVPGPRLVLAGRPFTSKKGHCWHMGGEVETVSEIEKLAKTLLDEGADVLKVMASGGGTPGSDPYNPQFDVEHLRTMGEEARKAGKPFVAHCTCTEAIRLSLAAGASIIAHGMFMEPDGSMRFADEVSKEALDRGVYWNPTLEVAGSLVRALRQSEAESESQLKAREDQYKRRAEHVNRLYNSGAQIISGSDEGWRFNRFGNFAKEIEALVIDAGMKPIDAIKGATSTAAKALRISDRVGSLLPGRKADILIVEGCAFEDITALQRVRAVFLEGQPVPVVQNMM